MLNALIADSDPESRYQLRHVLVGDWGLGIFEADNGVRALEQLSANTFRLLFLDLALPMLDGLQVLEQIRSRPQTARLPVVVTGTSAGQEASMRRLLELGVADFLRKPLQPERLSQRISDVVKRALGRTEQADLAPRPPKMSSLRGRNALVVEGDPAFRALLAQTLKPHIPTIVVATGTNAVRSVAFQVPDLVFVGEATGDLGGTALAEAFRSLPACHSSHLVSVLDSRGVPADEQLQAFHAVLSRESDPQGLEQGISSVLAQYGARMALCQVMPGLWRHLAAVAARVCEPLVEGGVNVTSISQPRSIVWSKDAMEVTAPEAAVRIRLTAGALAPVGGLEPSDSGLVGECLQLLGAGVANWIEDAGFRAERRVVTVVSETGFAEVTHLAMTPKVAGAAVGIHLGVQAAL